MERLAALSDGVFAVAITLLVLEIARPVREELQKGSGPDEAALLGYLVNRWPDFLAVFMSFLTLGIIWVGQQTQLNHFARSDRNLTWIHIVFLLVVTLMPFSTGLLARFPDYRTAVVVYWFNIFLLGVLLFASWKYAWRAGLVKEDVTPEVRRANESRIIIAQSLYAFGALLCVISTYLSIGFIFLVQLNYAIAPRIRPLYRL